MLQLDMNEVIPTAGMRANICSAPAYHTSPIIHTLTNSKWRQNGVSSCTERPHAPHMGATMSHKKPYGKSPLSRPPHPHTYTTLCNLPGGLQHVNPQHNGHTSQNSTTPSTTPLHQRRSCTNTRSIARCRAKQFRSAEHTNQGQWPWLNQNQQPVQPQHTCVYMHNRLGTHMAEQCQDKNASLIFDV